MKNDVAEGNLASTEKGSGARRNSGKVDFSLVPFHLLSGVARVLMSGELKYNTHNWAKGMKFSSSFSCLMRHLIKWFYCKEDLDAETGEHHLDHAMCNLLFLKHYTRTYSEGDDRPQEFTDFADWLSDINTPFDADAFVHRNPFVLGETWKPLPNFDGIYEVSDKGRVRSIDHQGMYDVIQGRIFTTVTNSSGQELVALYTEADGFESFIVTDLVKLAFGNEQST